MSVPSVQLDGLDHLWLQIAGTLCNLTCDHCFISCSPTNHSFEILPTTTALRALEDSIDLGVKEYYFTGGEPFLHPDLVEILERTLELGPATVLTNGTILRPDAVIRLAEAEARSLYSLELRVSIDGPSPDTNDPIRGRGTFARAMTGVRVLLEHGFLPVITVAQTWEDGRDADVFEEFVRVLEKEGYERPRVKIIPTLRIGAEESRNRGYLKEERVTTAMIDDADFDRATLLCTHSRIVTSRGVFVCPILIEEPAAQLGDTLDEARRPFSLAHGACYTCYVGGAICSNPSSGGQFAS